jgi:uncharacterized protein
MKKLLFICTILFSTLVQAQENVVPARPNPPRLVNDFTNTLTAAQLEALEQKLIAFDDSTSNQVAVVIIPSTKGQGVEDVALEIMRQWGVGGKENNNGVVLLIAKDDRKLRIETGYGLEGAIPDLTARSIIDNEITPSFKEGNYYRGIDNGVDAIMRAAAGVYKAPEGYGSKKSKGISWKAILFMLVILFFIFGSGGSGGGTAVTRRGSRGLGGFPWWLLLGGGGGSGGGGWSGGGGGGGGFGGFGGGSGGGGGASGSW